MALRIEDEYTESQAADANYPEGSFKNVSSPGGTDGTPFEKAWPNDIQGLLQRLLSEASITPSGAPDTVLASDYFDALNALFLGSDSFNLVTITASGSYAKPTGLKFIIAEGCGGGGGSGGAAATVGENSTSEGGAGGGYSIKIILASALLASETVTIGAAGAAGAVGNGDGGDGGTTSFGTHITCNGGIGGLHGDDTSSEAYNIGAIGGTATGGDINVSGGNSTDASVVGGSIVTLSDGGDSKFGRGGKAAFNGLGSVGTGFGSGGGGGSNDDNESGRTGVIGQPGVIYIHEFF